MKHLHGWYFTYNTYTKTWRATDGHNISSLINGPNDAVIESKTYETLIEIIELNEGDLRKVMKWKKNFKNQEL